ncbi:unnamed protein product [Boreogadus saida]
MFRIWFLDGTLSPSEGKNNLRGRVGWIPGWSHLPPYGPQDGTLSPSEAKNNLRGRVGWIPGRSHLPPYGPQGEGTFETKETGLAEE